LKKKSSQESSVVPETIQREAGTNPKEEKRQFWKHEQEKDSEAKRGPLRKKIGIRKKRDL